MELSRVFFAPSVSPSSNHQTQRGPRAFRLPAVQLSFPAEISLFSQVEKVGMRLRVDDLATCSLCLNSQPGPWCGDFVFLPELESPLGQVIGREAKLSGDHHEGPADWLGLRVFSLEKYPEPCCPLAVQ